MSFFMDAFSDGEDAPKHRISSEPIPDDLLYEAMAMGIDPASLDIDQLRHRLAKARGEQPLRPHPERTTKP
ncbi:hypothetical protein CSB20_04190 [bacterium DOLZORAL124_64_63]|nr:MAG: hypothetical protein CSB20_04190 [bacterium DOLZORAL124_64_63]